MPWIVTCMTPNHAKPHLTAPLAVHVSDVPAVSGLTETQVWQAIRDGSLPSLKIGRRRIVRLEAIDAFLRARERAGQAGRHGEGAST